MVYQQNRCAKVLTVGLASPHGDRRMAGQAVVSMTSAAQPLSIATVLMKRIDGATLFGDMLVHFLQGARRHGENAMG